MINHPTAWTSLAPHMSNTNVAAGPVPAGHDRARLPAARSRSAAAGSPRPRRPRGGSWPPSLLADVLWWAALALALRSFFEPVMVSYYPWPPMAVALIPAATLRWIRLVAAGRARGRPDRGGPGLVARVWVWWVPLVIGLAGMLALSRPRVRSCRRPEHRTHADGEP